MAYDKKDWKNEGPEHIKDLEKPIESSKETPKDKETDKEK